MESVNDTINYIDDLQLIDDLNALQIGDYVRHLENWEAKLKEIDICIDAEEAMQLAKNNLNMTCRKQEDNIH